jgi:hypothetical protein
MSNYRIKISGMDNHAIYRGKFEKFDDLKPIFKDLKKKMGEK